MKKNEVVIGDQTLGNGEILDGNCFISNSISNDDLAVDTLDLKADYSWRMPTLLAPSDADIFASSEERAIGLWPYFRVLVADPEVYEYGAPVRYYHDDVLMGLFFMASKPKRVGQYTYEISCTSAIGLLDNSTHYGGLYTGQPMSEVLEDIISGIVEYTLDQEFRDIPVYGWLPVGTRRENLHQLLFAEGCSAKKNADGTLFFTRLSEVGPSEVGNDRMFVGGSVDYGSPANKVLVSEHAYTAYASDKEATLFEGEVAAESLISPKGAQLVGTLVLFGGPMHDLVAENGSILESGVNYAVLGQSSDCKLTGKEYTHTIRVIARPEAVGTRAIVSRKDNEVSVTDATLVSLANSENVANRVMSYYGNAQTTQVDMVVQGERLGDAVSYEDPFGDRRNGFVGSMDLTMSGILRASTSLVSGYVPGPPGNYFRHCAVLTAGTSWTAPPECRDKIRAVLVGGGQGGYSGGAGEAGGRGSTSSNGKGGDGGEAGQGGASGKVFITTLPVAPGQTFRTVFGRGGAGGLVQHGPSLPGAEGGATTFGAYSSAKGAPTEKGYQNIFDGSIIALPGTVGIKGGKGNGGSTAEEETVTYNGVTYHPGATGQQDKDGSYVGYGGSGGGAAAGGNGGDGEDGEVTYNQTMGNGGSGGGGANGSRGGSGTVPGSGGHGGHGGGGGGGGGAAKGAMNWPGDGGDGGFGGNGGDGAPGCIIIYY